MKKRVQFVLGLALMFGATIASNAQKIEDERITVNTVHFPKSPLPTYEKGYELKTVLPSRLDPGDNRSSIQSLLNSFKIDYPTINPADKGYEVILSLENWECYNERITFSDSQTRNQQTGQTVTTRKYFIEYFYRYPLRVQIINKETGASIFDQFIQNSQDYKVGKTQEFNSENEAWNYWRSASKTSYITNLRNVLLNNLFKDAQNQIDNEYGFVREAIYDKVYTVKSTEKVQYPEYDKASLLAIEAYKNSAATVKLNPVFVSKLNEAVNIWNTALKESNPEDKKARIDKKVTVMTYRNLYIAYYYLNEPEKAQTALEKAKVLDPREDWIKNGFEKIYERQTRLNANPSFK